MNYKNLLALFICFSLISCSKFDPDFFKKHPPAEPAEDPSNFSELASIDIGDIGAAEISAYDPKTKRLFVVNNASAKNKIDVIDFANLPTLSVIASIDVSSYGFVNSVAVAEGVLAAAIEAPNRQDPGKMVAFRTVDYSVIAVVTVGAIPDMVTWSPDGKYVITANEGEPSPNYLNDPLGTVSIISALNNYSVVNLDFSAFAGQLATLQSKGLRKFGPNASFAQDMEPEYVTVSANSQTAWVTLQENNAIARINLVTKTVTDIFPLGFKDHNSELNAIDVSDQDGGISLKAWPVKGIYQPDAIAFISHNEIPYLFTANEGDAREYTAFVEARRVSAITLDPTVFPNAATLRLPAQLGRLNISGIAGDKDNDGDYDELYAFGARSFSLWNGNTGALVFDSRNDLDKRAIAAGIYDDTRSDDKSTEPEGLAEGHVGNKTLLFVGMERANAVATYDISDPIRPSFLQVLKTGVGPEGVLFIPAKISPNKRSLLVVSSEVDGIVKVFAPEKK